MTTRAPPVVTNRMRDFPPVLQATLRISPYGRNDKLTAACHPERSEGSSTTPNYIFEVEAAP
jgi:hypothetical protein